MSIAFSKTGDCSICSARDTAVRKRGKELFCLACVRKMDTKRQLAKQREKIQVRGLINYSQSKNLIPKGTGELQRWFEDRHKEMKGNCQHCGGKTEKNRSTYKCSIAHIFPKAHFKSVATHPDNWLELCFYGISCHTNLDNYALDISELSCFDEVIRKVVAIYPSIAKEERRRIPQVLLNYIETEK